MALWDRQSSRSILWPRMLKQKWQLLSAIKSYTPTHNTDVLQVTNNDVTNYTTKWQQTSITFLGYRALYVNNPLLDSWREFTQTSFTFTAWFYVSVPLRSLTLSCIFCCSYWVRQSSLWLTVPTGKKDDLTWPDQFLWLPHILHTNYTVSLLDS